MNPTVSIVVPCRNEEVHIETCIESILRQQLPVGGLEVIVADGMSDDGTREVLNLPLDVRFTDEDVDYV